MCVRHRALAECRSGLLLSAPTHKWAIERVEVDLERDPCVATGQAGTTALPTAQGLYLGYLFALETLWLGLVYHLHKDRGHAVVSINTHSSRATSACYCCAEIGVVL